MKSSMSRRKFIKRTGVSAAALSALSYQNVRGASDRISLGIIGCGSRGFHAHMKGVHKHDRSQNVRFTAVCDPWKLNRERAARAVKDWYGIKARQFDSYKDLLACGDVDAVMIASCDHQHTAHLEAAAQAGKDIYVEKPIGLSFERVKKACDAVKKAGVVCQVGTQLRSRASFSGCRELYRTGILGNVSRIEQRRNGGRPYWYGKMDYYKDKLKKQDVNWKEFLMHRPERPFDPVHYAGWYGFRDYTDGPISNLGCHFIDLVHYITGAKYPLSCVCLGGTFTWKDRYRFSCPDHVQALWIYPEDFMVSYSTNFGNSSDGAYLRIHGDQGIIRSEGGTLMLTPEGAVRKNNVVPGEKPVAEVKRPDHFLDWLICLRSRRQTIAPIEAGYQHSVACLMAVQSYDTGRRMTYDAAKRKIAADSDGS